MTYAEFGQWAVGYYGPWPQGMKADIRDWLTEKSPAFLDTLKAVCLETVPSRLGQVNGYPPDIAVLESLAVETGRRLEAAERHEREVAYAAKMLPAPDPQAISTADMCQLDWASVLTARIRELARAKAYQ